MAETSEEKRMNVTSSELEAADQFLAEDPIGRRVSAAEHLLVHFAKGQKLKRVKRFIFNMSFDLRQIADIQKFQTLIKDHNTEISKLIEQSSGVAEVRCSEIQEKGTIRFYLFYEQGLSETEYQFHSQNFGQCIAAILSSMQFDMSGFQGENSVKTKVASAVQNEITQSGLQVDVSKE